MSQLNDISLVAQVVVFRNTKAFDQLVKKYQSPVRRFFLNLTCGDNELSDDLAQDTFIKAYTNLASFKNLSNFSTWLYRIAYNVFYDYLRSRKETADLDTREVDTHWNTSQDDVGQQMDVYQALATLKEMDEPALPCSTWKIRASKKLQISRDARREQLKATSRGRKKKWLPT